MLEKKPGEIWIACIGESTTYDYEIECWEKAYPAQLESFLQDKGVKAKVINAGVDGWTSYEIMLDFVLRTSKFPLDYVIYYGGFNDLIFNRLIYPVLDKRYQVLGGYGVKGGLERVLDVPLWQWSSLMRFLNIKFYLGIPHFDYFSVRPGENSRFFELIVQLINGKYPYGIFKDSSPKDILKLNPPIFFRENINTIIGISRAKGMIPILVTYKINHCEESNHFLVLEGRGKKILNDFLEMGIKEMNDTLKGLASEYAVPIFDFAEAYKESPEDFADLIHNTEKGARVKAEMIGDFLLRNVISR